MVHGRSGVREPSSSVRTAQGARDRRVDLGAAALIAVWTAAVALTFGRRSLWEDEAYTVAMARLPWPELVEVLSRRELNGGLHTVLVKGLGLGTAGELALRAPSLLAVGLSAWVLYRMLLRYGAGRALVGTVVYLSLWPVAEAASMARAYGLLLLCVVTMQALVQRRALHRRGGALTYAVVAGAALYLHVFAALVVLAHAVAELLAGRDRDRDRPGPCWWWAGLPFAVLATPLAAFLLLAPTGVQTSWVPSLTPVNALYAGLDTVATGGPYLLRGVRAVLLLAALLMAAGLLLRHRRLRADGLRAGAVLVVLPLLVVAVSVVKPLLVGRYLWIVLPALVTVLVLGLSAARGRTQTAAVAVPLGLAVLLGLPSRPVPDSDYRGSVEAIEQTAGAGDVVLPLTPFRTPAVAAYAPTRSVASWPSMAGDAGALLRRSGYDELRCLPPDVAHVSDVYVVGQLDRTTAEQIARCSGRHLHKASFDDTTLQHDRAGFARFVRP